MFPCIVFEMVFTSSSRNCEISRFLWSSQNSFLMTFFADPACRGFWPLYGCSWRVWRVKVWQRSKLTRVKVWHAFSGEIIHFYEKSRHATPWISKTVANFFSRQRKTGFSWSGSAWIRRPQRFGPRSRVQFYECYWRPAHLTLLYILHWNFLMSPFCKT